MAESPQGAPRTDSQVRVHIPLPAVRPRQRSWGTSLPQSVILKLCLYGACVGYNLAPARAWLSLERQAQEHGSFGSSGSCPTMLVPSGHPMFGDFPACLTLFVYEP